MEVSVILAVHVDEPLPVEGDYCVREAQAPDDERYNGGQLDQVGNVQIRTEVLEHKQLDAEAKQFRYVGQEWGTCIVQQEAVLFVTNGFSTEALGGESRLARIPLETAVAIIGPGQ